MTDGPPVPGKTADGPGPAPASLLDAPGFIRRHVVLPFAAWAVGAAVFERTPLDFVLSDPFYDAGRQAWLGRHDDVIGPVFYYGGRYAMLAVGLGAFALWAASFRVARLTSVRRAAIYVSLCMAATGAVVVVLKSLINRGIPSDYDRYGGTRTYTPLFATVPPGTEEAHQFPAAHPSAAFALLALYFVARSRGTRHPVLGLLPGFALGLVYSFVQQVRGMHFASHDWWTLGIAWAVALGMLRLFRGRV